MNETIEIFPTYRQIIETTEDKPETFIVNPQEFREPELPKIEPKKKPTYPQNWQAYDKAKTNEDGIFKGLLYELLSTCVEELAHKSGRKGFTKKEKLCFMCIKVFYKSDLRKTVSILKELKNSGYIDRVPSFKSIDNFFNDKSLSEVLDDLILISSLPLANLEETGAID